VVPFSGATSNFGSRFAAATEVAALRPFLAPKLPVFAAEVVDGVERSGLTVVGLATSRVAAGELRKSTRAASYAIAKRRFDQAIDHGVCSDKRTLILVDEAPAADAGVRKLRLLKMVTPPYVAANTCATLNLR
jgi:hypothetical protein